MSARERLKGAEAITLRIAGRATTKQRPRFDPRTKRTYTPPSNLISENDVRAVWREAGEPRIRDDEAISIDLLIIVQRPQGHFKRDGSLSAEGLRHPIPRNKKPDVDNALKLVMDALNSRAYRDDVLIASVQINRIWGDWPETVVTLYPLSPADLKQAASRCVELSADPSHAPPLALPTDRHVGAQLSPAREGV